MTDAPVAAVAMLASREPRIPTTGNSGGTASFIGIRQNWPRGGMSRGWTDGPMSGRNAASTATQPASSSTGMTPAIIAQAKSSPTDSVEQPP